MKNQNFLLKIILVVLCLHLLYTNAEILLSTISEGNIFQKILMCFFGMSYSLLTTISIYKLNKILPIVVFSFLDGFAVFMRIGDIKTAVFYGLYTSIIVIVSFAIKQKETKENQIKTDYEQNQNKIKQLEECLKQTKTNEEQNQNKIKQLEEYIENSIEKSLAPLGKDEEKIKKRVLELRLPEDLKNKILTKKIKQESNELLLISK